MGLGLGLGLRFDPSGRARLRLNDVVVLGSRRDPPCNVRLEVVQMADGHLSVGTRQGG